MAYKFTIKGIRKFNEERVIEKFFDAFKEIEKIEDVKILNHNPVNDETDSYTVMTLNVSTQGVNIKHLVSKDILVELPWLASQMDVKLCYAYLNAVKKVYRGARILDEEEKGVKLTETEARDLFTPSKDHLPYLLCRQIIRDHGEATNKRGCGIYATLIEGTTNMIITLPSVWRTSK